VKKVILSAICVSWIFFAGCQAIPKTFEQGMDLLDKAAEKAEKHGTAYSGVIRWDGTVGGAWIQRGEVDTGVYLEFSVHGNAAAERPAVNSTVEKTVE